MLCKKKMCPGGTDSHSVAKFAYSHKKSRKDIFVKKGQSLWKSQDDIDHFETWARRSDVKHLSKFP